MPVRRPDVNFRDRGRHVGDAAAVAIGFDKIGRLPL